MSGRKYPLDPLIKLRDLQVDEATRDLAKAVDVRQKAENAKRSAEAARETAEERAARARDAERQALERGELSAADLMRAQAWELGVAEERKRLAQQVATAEQGEKKAREQEDGARGTLATREADAEVVEKDKDRFVAKLRANDLAKEEEAAEEAHGAKRDR
jgi:IgA-specific serine endopeptidase